MRLRRCRVSHVEPDHVRARSNDRVLVEDLGGSAYGAVG